MGYSFHPPALKIDEYFIARGRALSASAKVERRVVANLIDTLARHGWSLLDVNDGEGWQPVTYTPTRGLSAHKGLMRAAMEIVFSVDESLVRFHNASGARRTVLLICGNDMDIISDYTATEGGDSFSEAVDAFLDEVEKNEYGA